MTEFLRNLFFRDVWLKLFSLALAVLIWMTVTFALEKGVPPVPARRQAPVESAMFAVPVLVMSTAADVRDFKVEPAQVEVTVKAQTDVLEKLQAKDIHALVDLTGIESAQDMRKRIEVSTPPGVAHMRVVPGEVRVIVPPKR